MSASRHRVLLRSDVSAHEGWFLADWCRSRGGDEFTLTCLSDDSSEAHRVDPFTSLQPFSKGEAMREVVYCRRALVPIWELTEASLALLHQLLPDGIFTYRSEEAVWMEDFTIYRRGEMLLGVITHEELACLGLTEPEWRDFGDLGITTHEPPA